MSHRTIEWCRIHDTAMRETRTADDRIVCWFVWWSEEITDGRQIHPCKANPMNLINPITRFGTLFGRSVYVEPFDRDEERFAWDIRVKAAIEKLGIPPAGIREEEIPPQLEAAATEENRHELERTRARLRSVSADIQWLIDKGIISQ